MRGRSTTSPAAILLIVVSSKTCMVAIIYRLHYAPPLVTDDAFSASIGVIVFTSIANKESTTEWVNKLPKSSCSIDGLVYLTTESDVITRLFKSIGVGILFL